MEWTGYIAGGLIGIVAIGFICLVAAVWSSRGMPPSSIDWLDGEDR